MIPIRDTIPSKNYRIVNNSIIGINVVVYLVQISMVPDLNRFVYIYGLVPARYSIPQIILLFYLRASSFSLCSLSCFSTADSGIFWVICGRFTSLATISKIASGRFVIWFFTCFAELHPGLSHIIH